MENTLVQFNPAEVATSGQKVFHFILEHEHRKSLAEAELNQAAARDETIDAELIKAAMYLHENDEIDLYTLFSDSKDATQMLYRTMLVKLGVMERSEKETADGIQYVYTYTDDTLKNAYHIGDGLKKENEEEWRVRHNRVSARNIRLGRVLKAATAMVDNRASHTDIQTVVNEETQQTEIVIANAPKALAGEAKKVVLQGRGSSKYENATVTPTVTGLAKIATDTHKSKPKDASKADAESSDKPAGDGRMSEDDMLASCNMLVMAIKGREGTFTKAEKTALTNLTHEIAQIEQG